MTDGRHPGDVLVMFAKAPIPGQVKTRLAASLGDEAAAALQAAFLVDLGARFGAIGARTILACAPTSGHAAFTRLVERGWTAWNQGQGDLGARLRRTFQRAVAEGADRVVFIGSDSPSLPAELVTRAFDGLDAADVVLGPALDGGYYLVGARRDVPELFEDMPWGSDRVYALTVRRLDDAGVSYSVLPFWYDVDDLQTLRSLAGHLGLRGPYGPIEAPATARQLSALGLAEPRPEADG